MGEKIEILNTEGFRGVLGSILRRTRTKSHGSELLGLCVGGEVGFGRGSRGFCVYRVKKELMLMRKYDY